MSDAIVPLDHQLLTADEVAELPRSRRGPGVRRRE
jgi:hypothetical protein